MPISLPLPTLPDVLRIGREWYARRPRSLSGKMESYTINRSRRERYGLHMHVEFLCRQFSFTII